VDGPTKDNCIDKRIKGVPPILFQLHGEGEIFGELRVEVVLGKQ
jgi:hypothetical protein